MLAASRWASSRTSSATARALARLILLHTTSGALNSHCRTPSGSFCTGKDFTSSTKLHELIRSFIAWRGELSTRAAWSGFVWIALLLLFKYTGRVDSVRIRGRRVLRFFKITGPILVRRASGM